MRHFSAIRTHLINFLLRIRGALTAAPTRELSVSQIPHAAPTTEILIHCVSDTHSDPSHLSLNVVLVVHLSGGVGPWLVNAIQITVLVLGYLGDRKQLSPFLHQHNTSATCKHIVMSITCTLLCSYIDSTICGDNSERIIIEERSI